MQDIYRNHETEELVVMYQSTQREEYLQEIISRNIGLLRNWSWDYRNIPNYGAEDLLEEAYIACWQAVKGYEPERDVTFTTFLKVTVKQRYNRLYNAETRKKRYTGQMPVSWEELEEINRELSCPYDYSELEVQEFIASISGTIKEVAIMLYSGMTKGEVAKALGITPASISYHIKRLQQAYVVYRGMV